MRVLCLGLALCSLASAGEYVTFASGSRMRVDRHVNEGRQVRLFTGSAEVVVDASNVRGYEADEDPPPPAAAAAPAAAPQTKPAPATPADLADAAADKYGLPRALVRSVMNAESAMNPFAVSPKGAVGLMQLMPQTAKTMSANPYDAAQNVDAGARYLRDLLVQYNGGLWRALAAYNAGPGAVAKYKGVPPYPETVNYVLRVTHAAGED
ncbi:MAG TPA: lytic transglycosylase domain-containing protein [Bryobacteraceae bacterium]|nr:lytic transglycosylase domain-containing protein [Bryobacteraceae bacterium]